MRTYLALLICVVGCKGGKGRLGELKAIADTHRADAEKVFKNLEAIVAKPVAATGKLESPGVPLTEGNTIVLPNDPKVVHQMWTDPEEFDSGFGTHLAKHAWLSRPAAVVAGTSLVGIEGMHDPTMRKFMQDNIDKVPDAEFAAQKSRDEAAFAGLGKLKYVLVTDTKVYESNYEAGHASVDATLYDLAGKAYGGVHVDAQNSSSVEYVETVKKKTGEVMHDDKGVSLKYDLDKNIRKALQDTVVAQLPGSQLPCTKDKAIDAWCK